MASLYKNNGIWYIAVNFNGNRKCKSLKTKDIKVAGIILKTKNPTNVGLDVVKRVNLF
jgi:hypothetical protein